MALLVRRVNELFYQPGRNVEIIVEGTDSKRIQSRHSPLFSSMSFFFIYPLEAYYRSIFVGSIQRRTVRKRFAFCIANSSSSSSFQISSSFFHIT
jgi:hypothetical protein